ncbi:MAG: aminopeptidase [Treponema sp.]|jgi:aminopeptidase|nr:aminopeptidase [Treponema sp.]
MKDPRLDTLAGILVNYSIQAKPGDKVLIDSYNTASDLVRALIRAVYAAGAVPFVQMDDLTIERELLLGATEEQLKIRCEAELRFMEKIDCYIGFTAHHNLSALSDVGAETMSLQKRLFMPVQEYRVEKTRWVVLRYPTAALAQLAGMSEEAFENFFFEVCNFDYARMSQAMDPLKELIEKTDRVRLTGPGTDLRFSIKGLPAIKCDGGRNIPDGEVYTAPVRDSVNGVISYNTPSLFNGFVFENIALTFRDGKIIDAKANDTKRVNTVFDTDEGARYVGEFSFGVNPYILKPMKETLFDEKIAGSIHFTPGKAYEECNNGNVSAIHWDLVLIQRPEYGGGEVWFDDTLIRKDGLFVHPALLGLNPDRLKNC